MAERMFILLFFLLPIAVFSSDFEDAVKMFSEGRFSECEKALDKIKEEELSKKEHIRFLAMKEYLLGNDQDKIGQVVKTAKQIASDRSMGTDELLNHSALLVRRATEWKDRGIPEYQELSDTAALLLNRVRDNSNADIALKKMILQTKNYNLNGEYHEPYQQIMKMLNYYYAPAKSPRKTTLPSGAVQLLILAGEQHIGIGVRSNSPKVKAECFTSAAKFYLKAIQNTNSQSPLYADLSNRLHYCRETLRLLGYSLNLPNNIRPQSAVDVVLIDEMLRTRRFQDVISVLENNPNPTMRIRYLYALANIGEYEKVLQFVSEKDFTTSEPEFFLKMARNAVAAKKNAEASVLLKRYLAISPEAPDSLNSYLDCANLLAGEKLYSEASEYYLGFYEKCPEKSRKEKALFLAAQCLYQSQNYRKTIELLQKMPSDSNSALLLAQSKIRLQDYSGALSELKKLLSSTQLSATEKSEVLKLAIYCSMEAIPEEMPSYCKNYMTLYPDASESFDYAKQWVSLGDKLKSTDSDYAFIASWTASHQLKNAEAISMILKCASKMKDMAQKDSVYRLLLKRQDYTPVELKELLSAIPGVQLKLIFLDRYKKPFRNTPDICELYFIAATLETEAKRYANALSNCELLLKQEKVYRYKDTKILQAKNLTALGREKDTRTCWQELLQTKLTPEEKRWAVLALAKSWETSGESKKVIATAWTAIPVDGTVHGKQAKNEVHELLTLIIHHAEKIGSQQDIQDAKEILAGLTVL